MTSRAAFRSKFSRTPPTDAVASLVSTNTAGLIGALRVALTGLEHRLGTELEGIGKRVTSIADFTKPMQTIATHLAGLDRAVEALAKRLDALERVIGQSSTKDVAEQLAQLRTILKTVKAPPDKVSAPLKALIAAVEDIRDEQEKLAKAVDKDDDKIDLTPLTKMLSQDYEVTRDRDGLINGWRPKKG